MVTWNVTTWRPCERCCWICSTNQNIDTPSLPNTTHLIGVQRTIILYFAIYLRSTAHRKRFSIFFCRLLVVGQRKLELHWVPKVISILEYIIWREEKILAYFLTVTKDLPEGTACLYFFCSPNNSSSKWKRRAREAQGRSAKKMYRHKKRFLVRQK